MKHPFDVTTYSHTMFSEPKKYTKEGRAEGWTGQQLVVEFLAIVLVGAVVDNPSFTIVENDMVWQIPELCGAVYCFWRKRFGVA